MGYKKMNQEISFADLILKDSMDKNRCLEHLLNINNSINWPNIKSILMSHYTIGTSSEGAYAYPPLLLFKCLMLQKWFHIDSDPELESQINTEILRQFENQGLTINEGVAIDARLVKSASRPISNKEIKKQKKKRNTPEGKLDKNGKSLKFSRDLESDWIIKNDKPHYGLKEHASVDINHGFILATTLTPASVNDTNYLSYCTIFSRHTNQAIKKVYADKGYFGEPNRNFLSLNNIADGIMRKNTTTAKLTSYEKERNKKISKVRYIVEQYFGLSHLHDGAYRARFTVIIKNKFDCWYRQAAYNISRGLKILGTATI